jgi:nicotinamide N-methyltransferase
MSHSRSSSSSSNEFGDLFVNEEEEQRQAEAEAERQRVVLIDVPRCRPVATTPTPDAAAAEGPTTSTTTTATTTTTTIDALAPMTLTHRPSCHHSLWGHLLWNASRHIVRMMDDGRIPVKGRSVLELGAGLAAPSLVAASLGARCAVATDFADPVLLDGIADNVARAFLADDAPYRCSDAEIDPSLLGPEVRAAWQRLQAERGFTGKRAESAPSFEVSSAGAVWDKSAPASALHVKGLRWGNGGDIEPVMSLTGFGGFDVVILSDVLFNHPFHDALLATTARCLSRDRNARAYVVFSHHRVLKKADDLAFFDKCSAYGLTWSLDEVNDDYPLMFPDDPGAAEIRKPVYVYTLGLISSSMAPGDLPAHHRVPPLEKFSYDVVLQGTGVVETLVSAACARAGLSVLHLDGAGRYGGALTSVTHKDFKKLFGLEKDAAFGATALPPPVESTQVVAVYPLAEALSRGTNAERGVELQSDADRVLGAHNLAIDLPVMPMLARSHLLDEIAGSQMAESCELGNVHRVLHLSDAPPAPCAIRPVALTRADVFRAGSNVSPMDARRLLRFFGDVMERTAVERDTDDTDVHEADEAVRRWRSKLPEALQAAAATTPFARLVADHYKLSASAIDLITLGGFLVPETTCAEKGVHTLYTYLTSIGKYGGSTSGAVCSPWSAGRRRSSLSRAAACCRRRRPRRPRRPMALRTERRLTARQFCRIRRVSPCRRTATA